MLFLKKYGCVCYNLYQKVMAFCFPKANLKQALTTNSKTGLVDAIGTVEAPIRVGRAYYFNGSDNYINTGVKIQGQTAIDVMVNTNFTTGGTYGIIDCGANADANEGFNILLTSTGGFYLRLSDGVSRQIALITTIAGVINNVRFRWNGLNGGTITLTVNDVDYTIVATKEWVGDSAFNLNYGCYANGVSFLLTGNILDYNYAINGNDTETFDCEEETGTQSISRTGVIGTIGGTIATFHVADTRKQYSRANDVGYATCEDYIDVIIPIDSNGEPVICYETVTFNSETVTFNSETVTF